MNLLEESPVTAQAEQATVYATGMKNINYGVKPQCSATPDSNSSVTDKVNKVL